jgi:cytochrome P450
VTDFSHAADPARFPDDPTDGPSSGSGPDPFASAARLNATHLARDPASFYRTLRHRHGPVAPILLDDDLPAWLVLGYRELHYVTSNPDLFARDSRRWPYHDLLKPDNALRTIVAWQPSVLFTEGSEHQRRAGAIQDALAGVDQFEMRAQVEHLADRLIDSFAGSGEADLIADYAQKIPIRACAAMLGFAEAEAEALIGYIALMVGDTDEAVAGWEAVAELTRDVLTDRRRHPRADVSSRLLAHPAGLSYEDLVPDVLALLAAGQAPTADWIGNTLRLMLTDSRFAVTLSGGRRSIGQALREVLWEDTPLANYACRWAARGTQLGGQHIRPGDMLILSFTAANTDPALRPDAHAGTDGNNAHMAFSHGEHRCPYAAQEIAEVIAQTAVEVLLDRLPDITLAIEPDELVWQPALWVRGLRALPVRFSPS